MNTLSLQFRPFGNILSNDPMPKKDFIRLAHEMASDSNQYLVNLIQMIQFSKIYKEGEEIVFD